MKKFKEEKERKLKKEVEKFKNKTENEMIAFKLKMSVVINDFKKSRNIEYERMIQRHKNKLKDLEKQQKTELNFLTKKSKI